MSEFQYAPALRQSGSDSRGRKPREGRKEKMLLSLKTENLQAELGFP